MTKHALIYQKFLKLAQAVDQLTAFPALSPDEKCLIRYLNSYWVEDRPLTVVAAMNLVSGMSSSTAFRNLKKIRQKGYIDLEIDSVDHRVKYVRPTKQIKAYFAEHGKILAKL